MLRSVLIVGTETGREVQVEVVASVAQDMHFPSVKGQHSLSALCPGRNGSMRCESVSIFQKGNLTRIFYPALASSHRKEVETGEKAQFPLGWVKEEEKGESRGFKCEKKS